MNYRVISFYKLVALADPELEVARHKMFFSGLDIAGRIYIAHDGINAQLSGRVDHAEEYLRWMRSDDRFADIEPRMYQHHENVFPRMTVKVRKQLVALDRPVDFSKRGTHVSPEQWKQMLESGDDYLCIDVRNDYEWDVGHFKGFERPPCTQFREFPEYLRSLKTKHNPKATKVMMCCTGGIRCELYSAYLKDEGFEEVYQLQGGILKYGEEAAGKHWEGKLFVFDDRLAVDINRDEKTTTGRCHHCGAPSDRFYNCANMDCNELFLCCSDCLERLSGCCKQSCCSGKRVRPLQHQLSAKPFRKWYHYIRDEERQGHDRTTYAVTSSEACSPSKTS